MLQEGIDTSAATFLKQDQSVRYLRELASDLPGMVQFEHLGESEEGHPLIGLQMGIGKRHVSLMAGAHADEPVGPATLRLLCEQLIKNSSAFKDLLETYKLFIIPHINPDGEARNQPWIEKWPDPYAMILHRIRELPGRDIEFGYPDMRVENKAASTWWQQHAPFEMHINLHGMSVSEGALLLIDKNSIQQTADLQQQFQTYIRNTGFGFHDHDRGGEKGFTRIDTGLATTPESQKMREHFESLNDPATASSFHQNSMEFIRSLGGEPISLVTEFPLFKLPSTAEESPGNPENYLKLQENLPAIQNRLQQQTSNDTLESNYQLSAVPLKDAVSHQLCVIDLAFRHLNGRDQSRNPS